MAMEEARRRAARVHARRQLACMADGARRRSVGGARTAARETVGSPGCSRSSRPGAGFVIAAVRTARPPSPASARPRRARARSRRRHAHADRLDQQGLLRRDAGSLVAEGEIALTDRLQDRLGLEGVTRAGEGRPGAPDRRSRRPRPSGLPREVTRRPQPADDPFGGNTGEAQIAGPGGGPVPLRAGDRGALLELRLRPARRGAGAYRRQALCRAPARARAGAARA